MPKRKVAIVCLREDKIIGDLVGRLIGGGSGLFTLIALEGMSGDAPEVLGDFSEAFARLKGRNFDTLVFVTHGAKDDAAKPGHVGIFVQTATKGNLRLTDWYELSHHFTDLLNDKKALVALICHSSDGEFREAMELSLPAYTVASIGRITVGQAVKGALEFFRTTQTFEVEDLLHSEELRKGVEEKITVASEGRMAGWVPGFPNS